MQRIARPLALLVILGALVVPPDAAAQAHIQASGNNSINNIGNWNTINNINIDPETISKIILKAMTDRNQNTPEQDKLKAQIDSYRQRERAIQISLSTLNNEILEKDSQLQKATQDYLQLSAKYQDAINSFKNIDAKTKAQEELKNANFDRVLEMIDREHEKQEKYTHTGPILITASDMKQGISGIAAGLYVAGMHEAGYGGETLGFQPFAGAADFVLGSARMRGHPSFYLSFDVMMGPQLRIGAPGLVLSIHYYCPALTVQSGKLIFPLVGVGASIGVNTTAARIDMLYRYSMPKIIYPDRENLHFIGLAVALRNESQGRNQ